MSHFTLNPLSWLETDEHGHEVTRPATCDCGRQYTQYKIAFKFVEKMAEMRGEICAANFVRETGQGWVPVYCPACESKELGRLANRVTIGRQEAA